MLSSYFFFVLLEPSWRGPAERGGEKRHGGHEGEAP
jgi:hypothetical protein